MENDIELMTNQELKTKLNELTDMFENQKMIIATAYTKMLELQDKYSEIEKILNKRGEATK